jgi:cytochrome P450
LEFKWALIDLCKHPEEQDKLRAELASFSAEDPTWEQLTNGLPYLDAVVCETLRLHPSIPLTLREVWCPYFLFSVEVENDDLIIIGTG